MNPIPPIGHTIAGYQLVRMIGKGGAGAVFLGHRESAPPPMPTEAAIKILVLPWQLDDNDDKRAKFYKRFAREAETLQRLRHSHIVSLLGFGEEGSYTYMILPYLVGGTLADKLTQSISPMPFSEVMTYLGQLADAIDYAHTQNVVHRDIKPANVLLDTAGQVYLSDFGIVRLLEETRTQDT